MPPISSVAHLYETRFDPSHGVLWASLTHDAPFCFTPALLGALRQGQREVARRVRAELEAGTPERLRYQVFASRIPGVFSLGGDLALFRSLVRRADRDALLRYGREAIDLVYTTAVGYDLPVITVSLVQGQALGGGFECALAAHVVVAERDARLGLPEVLFNLFPGMGAYQLLARRLSPVRAEQLILSGRTYTAQECYEMGLVDVLAEDGEGVAAVERYIRLHRRRHRAETALRRAVLASDPLDYRAMVRSVEVWVDAALALEDGDLGVLDHLLRAQQRLAPATP